MEARWPSCGKPFSFIGAGAAASRGPRGKSRVATEVEGVDIRAAIGRGIPYRVTTLSDDTSAPGTDFESTQPQTKDDGPVTKLADASNY